MMKSARIIAVCALTVATLAIGGSSSAVAEEGTATAGANAVDLRKLVVYVTNTVGGILAPTGSPCIDLQDGSTEVDPHELQVHVDPPAVIVSPRDCLLLVGAQG